MNYYKGYQQATAPFVLFNLVAESIEELQALELENDPLIKDEDNFPSYEGDICHLAIQNGVFIPRSQTQIDEYIASTAQKKTVAINAAKSANVQQSTFTFGGKEYLMDEASQKRYEAIFAGAPANHQIQTQNSVETLNSGDIDNFKTAYYAAVILATEP